MLNILTFLENALLKEMLVQELARVGRVYQPAPDANHAPIFLDRPVITRCLQKILEKVGVKVFPHVEEKIVSEVLEGLK